MWQNLVPKMHSSPFLSLFLLAASQDGEGGKHCNSPPPLLSTPKAPLFYAGEWGKEKDVRKSA